MGSGLGVLDRWDLYPDRVSGAEASHRDPGDFQRLTRDLYVAAGDIGFWQGALRDPTTAGFKAAREAIQGRRTFTIDLLYGDHEGGQRTISRFALTPHEEDEWLASVSRHWNLDRADPR